MKLSLAAELAVRGATVLAIRYGDGPIALAEICAPRDLPRQYLAKIFSALVRAGLVRPQRGKKGGYQLARDPAAITVLEIIEAVEGPITLNFCQQEPPECDQEKCPVRPVWAELQKTIRDRLGSIALADCVRCAGLVGLDADVEAGETPARPSRQR
jgi:Rrf2 family protein